MEMTEIHKALTLTYNPHPLLDVGRKLIAAEWAAGRTIREHVLAQGIDPHREIVIRHNNRLLTVEEWDSVCPIPGDLVNIEGVVSGGDGGSNPIASILSIVLMIVAPMLAPMALGAMGVTATTLTLGIATSVIALAGNLIISALFRPSQSTAASTGVAAASPTYSLSGGSNSMRPYEPLAVVMGNHRIFPDYSAKPYTEYEGEDQYLYQVFNFGIGEVALSDLRIGETLLSTYSDVTLTYAQNGVLQGFYGNVDTVEGAELDYDTGWIQRTSGADTTRLALDLAGTFYAANDEGGLDERSANFQIEYSVKDANSWQPFVPTEYQPVENYWAKGYWTETVTESHYEYQKGVGYSKVPASTVSVWKQTGFDTNLSASAHTENSRAGAYFQDINRRFIDSGADSQSLIWRWVPVGTDPYPTGPYNSSTNTLTLSGKSAKPLRKTVSRIVDPGQYDVRMRRISADETDSRNQSAVTWQVLRSYQEGVADYTNQTVLGVKIKATGQLNGAIQQLSAIGTRNALVWTGSAWAWQATTNPAWWYLDFVRGYRNLDGRLLYGCGLDESQIDLPSIIAWATFCTANELTFSAVLDRQQTAADVLTMITRCGFGSPSWASGKLGVVWDAVNQSPVMAFGMSNICKGSFEVAYVTEDLADEIIVNYTNRNNSWQQDQVRVTVPGTTGTPLRPSALDVMGCTTNAMAAKFANAIAAQQVYRRRMVTWETDFEGFVCQRGDVVLLSHDLTQWGYSGRVVSLDGSTITLDRSVPRSGGTEHLMLTAPDGTMDTLTVVAGSGDSDTLTLTAPATLQDGYGPIEHKWCFSPLATPGKKVKIVSTQPISESRVRLIATDEYPEYYAAWNGVFTAPTQQTLLTDTVSASHLKLSLAQIIVDDFQVNRVTAAWRQVGATKYCSVRAWLDGALIGSWPEVTNATVEIDVSSNTGTVSFEVVPFGTSGSGAAISGSIELSTLPAPAAPSLSATAALFAVALNWSFGDARTDVRYTEVWFSTSNDRAAATRITTEPYPATQYSHIGMEPGQGGYYWARVVDTRGNVSEWSAESGAGAYAVVSTDPTDLLTQLQDALGMPQLAAELASPIGQIPTISTDLTQTILDIEDISDRVLFERAVTDATVTIDPVTGEIELLATVAVTTDVESRLTQVESDLNAAEGSLTNTVATLAIVEGDLETAQSQIQQLANEVSLGISQVQIDEIAGQISGDLTLDSASAAQALAETAIRQSLGLDTATDKELLNRSRIAVAEFDIQTNVDDISAEASARLLLAATVAGNTAAIVEEQTARAEADSAEATARQALAVVVGNNAAAIQTEQTTRANADSALSSQITTLQSTANGNVAAIQTEATARANADSALSSQISTVQATLGSNIASVQTTANAAASAVDGVEAKWGVKVQTMSDGKRALAGVELLAGTDGESVFAVLADKLLVYKPDGTGTPKQVITLGTVNGITALGVDGSLVVDGSVVARHLAARTITADKIAVKAITAASGVIDDLAVGTLQIAGHAVSQSFAATAGSGAYSASLGAQVFFGGSVHIVVEFWSKNLGGCEYFITRDGSPIAASGAIGSACGVLTIVDSPSAGVHTYAASTTWPMNVIRMNVLEVVK